MAAPLGLAQQELRAPANDVDAVPEEFFQHLLDRKQLRAAVDQGQQNDADGFLQRRKLVELIEHQLRIGILLEVNREIDRLPFAGAGVVADVLDAVDPLILDEIGDGLVQRVAGLLIGNLVDDDLILLLIDAARARSVILPRPVR